MQLNATRQTLCIDVTKIECAVIFFPKRINHTMSLNRFAYWIVSVIVA